MGATDAEQRLLNQLLAACGSYVDEESWGVRAVLDAALRFAWIDDGRSELVVNYRAVVLGMLAVGSDPGYREQYQNTATWFVDWLRSRIPGRSIDTANLKERAAFAAILERWETGYRATPSQTVMRLLENASTYAQRTMERPRAGLRHIFAAFVTDRLRPMAIPEIRWRLTPADAPDLARHLLAHIGHEPEPGESMPAWHALFDEASLSPSPRAEEDGGRAAPAPAFLVSGFSADRTSAHEGDPLETDADVLALARLICHEDADPPISIGVFGGWGSGKSTFMEALQRQVALLAAPLAETEQPVEGPRFVSPIVQIRFNAWQFADANLWASLTAEFFDQLRAGGFEGGGKRIHARLVENVNEHVRGLSSEASERRAAVAAADEKLRDAQSRHDEAVRGKDAGIRQALVTGLAEAFDRNKGELARYGLIDPNSDEKLAQFIGVTRDARTQAGQIRHIAKILAAQWPLLMVVLLIAALVVFGARSLVPDKPVASTLAGLLAAAAGLLPLAKRGLAVMHAIVRQVGPLADRIGEAEQHGLRQVLETEVALRSAAEEAEALRAVSQRADRALARYVDPAARANPPRVLRYLLEDDPDTKAFEKEIGLIGRARRLFQALDEIVAHNREKLKALRIPAAAHPGGPEKADTRPDADAPDPEIPARIILYIDDLDRCTHEQVYKVLQAVHLLLAFELFVVVVAVDVAWVEAAVAKSIEFAGADSDEDAVKEAGRRRRAIEYLSKIFQLPFWLKPFSGRDDTRYAKYIRSLTRAAPAGCEASEGGMAPAPKGADGGPPSRVPPAPASRNPDGSRVEEREGSGGDGPLAEQGQERVQDPVAVARALKTLQLSAAEEDFLASADISAVAAPDPRGVKRLVNVYKIVRARLSETDETSILGGAGRPPAYPLIAVCAAVETGQPLEIADSFYQSLKVQAAREPNAKLTMAGPIGAAMAAAVAARGGLAATSGEMCNIARVVRRYSFNRYH